MILATVLLLAEAFVTADHIAVDNVTKSAVATGHVNAVCGVVTLRSTGMSRDENGVAHFFDPTCVTTCTNEVGHTHWNVSGEVEYKADDYVIVKNAWLKFCEIPIMWLPYLWYPLDTDCGFAWMPGWTSQWGAYMLTKYSYHIIGDHQHDESTWWLKGATRFDMRMEQGFAVGEDLDWQLNGFGRGYIKGYYAWDQSDDYGDDGTYQNGSWNYTDYGSDVPEERWSVEVGHKWEPSEHDVVRVKGSMQSDSYFRDDFFRDGMFVLKNEWLGYDGNEVAWEHHENSTAVGVSASGPLNKFYSGTSRLPELYFDINPQQVFSLPINYESQTRVGYLRRQPAEYGIHARWLNPYSYDPGNWADYDTFRADTYHRLSMPFRTLDDVMSVVPRIAYRGTYWNACGGTHTTGYDQQEVECGGNNMYRSIAEAGVTFAGRGTASINNEWSHMTEPYLDVLAQEAMYNGAGNGRRPYVFDNLDASQIWEDQFAGRGRNLPYTYYGVTPGWRNAWQKLEENGNLRTVFDLDVYAAIQLNKAKWDTDMSVMDWYDVDAHKLAEAGSPNYGERNCLVVPGVRARWMPDKSISVMGRTEWDSERNRVAMADLKASQIVSKDLKWNVLYCLRDSRWWDYSSSPYVDEKINAIFNGIRMSDDEYNYTYYHTVRVGMEHKPLDWFQWSPFVRWDIKEGELDCVGAWFDYLTDCLGFRLIVSYDNSYTLLDGYERDDRMHIGFMIYLRALGADASNIFSN